ncbi:DUF3592 domain-containing protein [Micromonospora sp. NPDC047467]|uniref:DUF3592 domain-containing protein n=1 Tax=Micromonospora sp. NPDC047467 TaxID=3154814 RepID=UPI0033E55D73
MFSVCGLLLAVVLTAAGVWSVANDHRGSETVAEVRDIEHRGVKTLLTVQFTTERGEACASTLRSARDRSVAVGERIPVRYAKSDPCLRVRERNDQSGWVILLIAMVLLMAFAVLSYVAWRRPRPPLPLRYAGMP